MDGSEHDGVQDLNILERLVRVAGITGIHNGNAKCAEELWTIELGKEYRSSDEEKGDDLASSIPHYHTNFLREVYRPRKISSLC